jgi:hypothetical protein
VTLLEEDDLLASSHNMDHSSTALQMMLIESERSPKEHPPTQASKKNL